MVWHLQNHITLTRTADNCNLLLEHNHGTRQRNRGHVFAPKVPTTLGRSSYSYTWTMMWNGLPTSTRNKPGSFIKTAVMEYIFLDNLVKSNTIFCLFAAHIELMTPPYCIGTIDFVQIFIKSTAEDCFLCVKNCSCFGRNFLGILPGKVFKGHGRAVYLEIGIFCSVFGSYFA